VRHFSAPPRLPPPRLRVILGMPTDRENSINRFGSFSLTETVEYGTYGERLCGDGFMAEQETKAGSSNKPEVIAIKRDEKGRFIACKLQWNSWTDERRAIFFASLAQTSNIKRSAKAAGLSYKTAYRKRKSDPGFAREFDIAVAEGFAHLELEMLHRARFGTKTVTTEDDGEVVKKRITRRGYSDNLAMALLARHQASADRGRAIAFDALDDEDAKIERLAGLIEAYRNGEGPEPLA